MAGRPSAPSEQETRFVRTAEPWALRHFRTSVFSPWASQNTGTIGLKPDFNLQGEAYPVAKRVKWGRVVPINGLTQPNEKNMNTLSHYQALERTGLQMVNAASMGDWNEVSRLEGMALVEVDALRMHGNHRLTSFQLGNKSTARLDMLKSLLRLDAQIRNLAEPGWITIEQWLEPTRRRQVDFFQTDTHDDPLDK